MALNITDEEDMEESLFPHNNNFSEGVNSRGIREGGATVVLSSDGSGDSENIREAINLLPKGGGVIFVKEGTYNINSLITINKNNVSIIGSGRATIFDINTSTGFKTIANYTTFENNLCEDALNIIRSHFNVKFCSFDNIFADAFDSDFCTGNVYKTFFTNIANDAIDFSGSNIFIEECEIDKANDKGISGGENSNLTVINSKISNSNIGIASKDLSTIEVSGTVIDNCNFGVVAFRKKPEYGAAKISTHLLTITNIERKYLIEQNSVFIFNGDSIYGTEQNVARLFYSPEEN